MILTTAERSRRSRLLIQFQLFDDMRRVEIIPLLDHVLIFIQIERPDHRHMDTTTSRWDLADSEVKRPIVRRARTTSAISSPPASIAFLTSIDISENARKVPPPPP
jgi:hypothetical protein